MGEDQLVDTDLSRGKKLLERLDRERVAIDAAFWFQDEEGDWKLFLHTPILEKKSRTQAYKAIQKALSGFNDSIGLQSLNLLREDDPLLRTMKRLVSTGGAGISDIRLTRNFVDGVLIRDAVVYRL